MPKTNPNPDFLTELARYNAINGVSATFSEMKKTARRLERAFNARKDTAVEAAEFIKNAYDKEYGDPTGETAVAHVMNPAECDHNKSVQRRLAVSA